MDVWIINIININQFDEIIINYDSIKNISCFEEVMDIYQFL